MRVLVFFLFSFSSSGMCQKLDSLLTLTDLPILRSRIQEDSILQLENNIAIYFHELVNEHRTTKKKKTLFWSDTLWIAARNHTVWMAESQKLSHVELTETLFFSGKTNLDRLKFILSPFPVYSMIGENCMRSSYVCSDCKTPDELAMFYANEIFVSWKKSPGHNQNMLQSEFTQYGLGVRFDKSGKVWSTMVLISFGEKKTGTRQNPR